VVVGCGPQPASGKGPTRDYSSGWQATVGLFGPSPEATPTHLMKW